MAYKAISKAEAKRFVHEVRKAHDVIIERIYAHKDTVTAANNGLAPKLPDEENKFLNGKGEWAIPPNDVYTLQSASDGELGGVKIADNTGITIGSSGVISVVPASSSVIGGIKFPTTNVSNTYLRGDGTWVIPPDTDTKYTLPAATNESLGGVIAGDNISISADGKIGVSIPGDNTTYLRGDGTWDVLPTMSPTVKGGAKNGSGLVMTGTDADIVQVDLRTAIESERTIPLAATIISGKDDVDISEPYLFYRVNDDGGYITLPREEILSFRLVADDNYILTTNEYSIDTDEESMCIIHIDEDLFNTHISNNRLSLQLPNFSIGNITLGEGLYLTGDTINVSGNSTTTGEGIGYFKNFTDISFTAEDSKGIIDEVRIQEESFDLGVDTYFEEQFGRAPVVGDIALLYAPGNETIYILRTSDKWVNLGTWGWQNINPLLTIKDREKLDSLPYILPVATNESLGGVIVGDNISVSANGKIGVDVTYEEFSEQDVLDVFIND